MKDAVLLNASYEGCVVLDKPTQARGSKVDVTDKATGETLFKAGLASLEDVDAAVAAATKAQIEWAGAPAGFVTVVPGDGEIGAALCTHSGVNMVSFTGSTATGRKVGAAAGECLEKVALELGGNNATTIFPDSDLAAVASATAFASFFHQGQICFSIGRHLVHEDVADEYAKVLAKKAANLFVGDPANEQVHLGPMIWPDWWNERVWQRRTFRRAINGRRIQSVEVDHR